MSYPRDLDEYAAAELNAELQRRVDARNAGLCDYCGQPAATSTPCRFPKRHESSAAWPSGAWVAALSGGEGSRHKDADGR